MIKSDRRGRIMYVPFAFENQLNKIMIEEKINTKGLAFKKAAELTILGQEAKKSGIDFTIPSANLPDLGGFSYQKRGTKRRQNR